MVTFVAKNKFEKKRPARAGNYLELGIRSFLTPIFKPPDILRLSFAEVNNHEIMQICSYFRYCQIKKKKKQRPAAVTLAGGRTDEGGGPVLGGADVLLLVNT